MKNIYSKLLYIIAITLSLFGITMIYSASKVWSLYKYNNSYHFTLLQFIFFIAGLILINIISKIDYNKIKKYSNLILFISLILLIIVLIPGIGVLRNGSRSWFKIGPIGFQPSEITKIALIIFVSKYLSNNENEMYSIKKGLLPILFIILIFLGIIMLEPDFGTAFIIGATLITMIFISKTKISFFIKIFILACISVFILIIIAPYRISRIMSFLNPWKDPLGSGFQIIQSLYAVGPSGILGKGFLNSIQKYFYLPEPQTDFIFSIISEELGIFGIIILDFLFISLYYISMKIFFKTKDLFGKYLVFGLSFGIILQALLNLFVVTGLIPVTGVTLPFISYGGSSLLVSMASIGIILNISKSNY